MVVVGSVVKVTTKNWSKQVLLPNLYPNVSDTIDYIGTVIPNPKWVTDANEFCITSDDPRVGWRVINLKNVISLDGTAVAPITNTPVAKTVVIMGSKGDNYIVTLNPDGTAHCECAGFGYRKKCSHIDKARAIK
jgi:hypothetical protein